MNLTQLQSEGPRLVAMHSHLIKPGGGLMLRKKAQAERRFKKRHVSDKNYVVAGLCTGHTCKIAGISPALVHDRNRRKPVADARHIAMTAAYELSGLSTIALGKLFRRGHDMILWAQKRVSGDRALRARADKVIRAVKKELRRK